MSRLSRPGLNNRFLEPVNKQILRALNETGAAASMRQMVDLNIDKNLVGWWHSDNVATRFASPDTFITQANDSSGGANNAAQSTQSYQPKLVSDSMLFNNSFLPIIKPSTINTLYFTISLWVKSPSAPAESLSAPPFTAGEDCTIIWNHGDANLRGSFTYQNINSVWVGIKFSTLSANTFYFLTVTYNNANITTYTNGVLSNTLAGVAKYNVMSSDTFIGKHIALGYYFNGNINDLRVFDKVLSAAEVLAIYNQTKTRYGL